MELLQEKIYDTLEKLGNVVQYNFSVSDFALDLSFNRIKLFVLFFQVHKQFVCEYSIILNTQCTLPPPTVEKANQDL